MDGNTNSLTLLDSGSQITVVKADPNDVLDSSINLESVGGDSLPCYGRTTISIKIGRKQYHMPAVKARVKETILGWDFIKRHRLDFVWTEFGDVKLIDKVNKNSQILQYSSIPHKSSPQVREIPHTESDALDFNQISSLVQLNALESLDKQTVPETVAHNPEYLKIV